MQIKCPNCGTTQEIDISHYDPGQLLVMCKSCNAKFVVPITSSDYDEAETKALGHSIVSVTCPYCGREIIATIERIKGSELWRCPACRGIFRASIPEHILKIEEEAEDYEPVEKDEIAVIETVTSENLPEAGDVEFVPGISDVDVHEDKLPQEPVTQTTSAVGAGVSFQSPDEEIMPPLTEKEKFTERFLVKMGDKIAGPMSFALLENWARSGIMGPNALIARMSKNPNKFFPAKLMPELKPYFFPQEPKVGTAMKEILMEVGPAELMMQAINSGALGGLVAGLIFAPIILAKLWQPVPIFSPILQVIVLLGFSTVVGLGIGAINSILERWIISYPWTTLVQSLIALLFAIFVFVIYALRFKVGTAVFAAILAFAIFFLIGLFTCQFHRKYETPE